MGSAQSYISSEAALTALVVAGAIGLGYTQIGRSSTTVRSSTDTTPQSGKGKKKRTKPNVVFSGDFSDKGHTDSDKLEHLTVQNSPPGFPGQFEPTTSPDSHLSDIAVTSSSLSKAKKPKKKKTKSAATTDPIVREVVASSSADYSSEVSNKSRTKNVKRQQQPQSSSSQMTRVQESTASIDTDGSWTRVGSVRRQTPLATTTFDATTSDADTGLTPQTGSSSPVAERGTEGEESSSFLLDIGSRESGENPRKTLAEKLLPKPRKTGVDELSFNPLV